MQAPGDADLSAIVTAGVQALRDFRAGPRETDVCELDTEKVGTPAVEGGAEARFVVAGVCRQGAVVVVRPRGGMCASWKPCCEA